ncbi:MAG: hypothetical protein AAGG48_10720 [Planctomycetota bacterium]
MFRQLNQFQSTINASISQGDSSFAAQAIALSNAVSGGGLPELPDFADPKELSGPDFDRFRVTDESAISLEPTVMLDQQARYLKHLHTIRRVNEGDDTSDSPGYSLNLVRIPVSILPGKATRQGFGAEVTITAEPVLSDDLMPTTFRNLAINDVVDFMGLPLVRCTERIVEVEKILSEIEASRLDAERTKAAIQELVTKFYDLEGSHEGRAEFIETAKEPILELLGIQVAVKAVDSALDSITRRLQGEQLNSPMPLDSSTEMVGVAAEKATMSITPQDFQAYRITSEEILTFAGENVRKSFESKVNGKPNVTILFQQLREAIEKRNVDLIAECIWILSSGELAEPTFQVANSALQSVQQEYRAKAASVAVAPSGRARRALNPFNPSAIEPVIGLRNLSALAKFLDITYSGKYIRWNGGKRSDVCSESRVDLLDARRFLRAEAEAAYELLSSPRHAQLFARLAAPSSQLAEQIRGSHFDDASDGQIPSVSEYRQYFFKRLHDSHHDQAGVPSTHQLGVPCVEKIDNDLFAVIQGNSSTSEAAKNGVEALAWAIVVESALLNERLNQDIRKLANAKEVYELQTDRDFMFFLPDTVQSTGIGLEFWQSEFQLATQMFQRYVKARWPIHVFAIDPVTQDQNVADVSQRQRELQFALALGFTSGQIGINSLTQYSRELQTQIETVSLNRTVVGFGHGADTFGWRFYPRVQALDVPGTLGTLRETIMGANRDYDLKHRRIESGQRECVAIVLMPSFVPYADFDIRTNWFKLTNPKNSALTMKDSVRLSRAVTAMRSSKAQCSECQHLYRQGEVERLFKRIDQLDRELPLQSQRALIPYENTLGGFEMFNTGVTDLTPELIGWYGAPGINQDYNACGCYQGCNLATGGCSTSTECTALQARVATIEQRLANTDQIPESPIPACEGPGTTLFLVGDNFSVHDTKVIAGGICIPQTQLISRDIMRVTIPHCVETVTLCENGTVNEYVSIYVATPYGVTNHLHVPVIKPADTLTVTRAPSNAESRNVSNASATMPSVSTTPASVQSNRPSSVTNTPGVASPTASANPSNSDCGCTNQAPRTFTSAQQNMPMRNQMQAVQPRVDPQLASLLQQGIQIPTQVQTQIPIQGLIEAVPLQAPVLEGLIESDASVLPVLVPAQPAQAQIDVNVNYAEPHRIKSKLESGPILNRVKTEIGEHWRNLRDKIPSK